MAHSARVHLVHVPGLPRRARPADPTRAARAEEPRPRPETRPAGGGPPLGHHRAGLRERQVGQESGQISRAPGGTGQVSWGGTAQDSESAR